MFALAATRGNAGTRKQADTAVGPPVVDADVPSVVLCYLSCVTWVM
jgi:hypothetical protein